MNQSEWNASVESNKATVRSFVEEVFNAANPDAAQEVLSERVVDHHALIFDQPAGPEGVVEGVRMLLASFPDFRVELLDLLGEGDRVVARLRLSGTNTEAYRRGEATLRRASWEAVAIFRLDGGRIAELWGTADRMSMLTQLGLLPDIGGVAAG